MASRVAHCARERLRRRSLNHNHDTNLARRLGRPETRRGLLVLREPAWQALLYGSGQQRTPRAGRRRSRPRDCRLSRPSRRGLDKLELRGSRRLLAGRSHRRADDRAGLCAVPHELPTARKHGAAPARPPCAPLPRRSCSRKTVALGAETGRRIRVRSTGPVADGGRRVHVHRRARSDNIRVKLSHYQSRTASNSTGRRRSGRAESAAASRCRPGCASDRPAPSACR